MNPKAEFKSRTWLQLKNLPAMQAGVLLLCLAVGSSKAQTYKVLHSFTGSDGSFPRARLLLSRTTLYGTTYCGGIKNDANRYGCGTVFKMNTDGTGFTVLHSLNASWPNSDGEYPFGDLVLSGNTLYGTAEMAGFYGNGTVFKINTDGTGFAVIKNFTATGWNGSAETNADGAYPVAGLTLSGTTLYGTTEIGGVYGGGTVFSVNTNGSGFTVLKNFTGGSDGGGPWGGLVLSGTTLYGTTMGGGITNDYWPWSCGTVFKVNTDGTGFTTLYRFTGIDAEYPYGELGLSGTTLYGTTSWQGSSTEPNYGTVFKVNTDGSGFTVLKSFANWPVTEGIWLSGSTLYGTTAWGGSYNLGALFSVNTNGGNYSVLMNFNNTNGASPQGAVLSSGTTLYGTTSEGGISNNWCTSWNGSGNGVVFSLSVAPPSLLTPPPSQTAEVGSTVNFKPVIAGDPVMTYEWFFNRTNCISCSTNCNLELTNVQFSQSGNYTVVVTNFFGAVTNSSATLNVIAPVARRPVPGVKVIGEAGSLLNVDYANSLNPALNWTTLGSVSLTSTSQYYFDVTLPLPTARFYRAWQTGAPSVVPSLNLRYFVPAITLTGNVGNSLELDYINQFGPTNAWVTLGTVTLTNTSQLYFDVSAIGQPTRLYQIVPVP
jgi:uncharacterized repeat protein (TIGR03803 family)